MPSQIPIRKLALASAGVLIIYTWLATYGTWDLSGAQANASEPTRPVISLMLAICALAACCTLSLDAWARNDARNAESAATIGAAALLSTAFGSPLFYLAANPSISHASALADLCWSGWLCVALLRISERRTAASLALLCAAIAAGLAWHLSSGSASATGSADAGWQRLLPAITSYFEIRSENFSTLPTFARAARLEAAGGERLAPLSLTAPWLLACAAFGTIAALRSPRRARVLACLLALPALSLWGVSAYPVSQLGAAALLPCLLAASAVWLEGTRITGSFFRMSMLLLLISFSVFCTVATTFDLQILAAPGSPAPEPHRQRLQRLFHPIGALSVEEVWKGGLMSPLGLELEARGCHVSGEIGLRGSEHLRALELPSGCWIEYAAPANARGFQALVGLKDASHECEGASGIFRIGNERGEVIYESPELADRASPVRVTIPILGAKRIALEFVNTSPLGCARGVWADLDFMLE